MSKVEDALESLYAAEDTIRNSSEQSGLGYVRDARQALEAEVRE